MGNTHINQNKKQASFELDGKQYEIDFSEVAVDVSSSGGGAFDEVNSEKLLYRTLALDHIYRKPGAKRPLYSLSDLKGGKWKDDISPYFIVHGSKSKKEVKMKVDNDEQFSELFYLKYPMLMGVDMTHVLNYYLLI